MIELKNIKKIYNKKKSNEFEALHNVSLSIEEGELVAIIGQSGAGKSTLLHIIACIDSYENGEYYLDGSLVKGLSEKKLADIRNRKVGIVMQDFALVEDFTCIENVLLPLDFAANKVKNKKILAKQALDSVGLLQLANKKVNQLSGGQKQRVAIARAIVHNPSVLIADEPTGALDTKTSDDIMDLFISLNQSGKTVIIVTHDSSIAERCNRVIEIKDGNIVE